MSLQVRRASWRLAGTCALIVLATTSVPGPGLSAAAPVATTPTSIIGTAWHADNTPIPHAKLRLRNVTNGRIEATTVANAAGQFVFTNIESGTYIVELVSEKDRILATGHTLLVDRGETAVTFVRLSTKVPWFDGFFSNAAATIAAAAASLGVTAVAPEQMPCASPPCK